MTRPTRRHRIGSARTVTALIAGILAASIVVAPSATAGQARALPLTTSTGSTFVPATPTGILNTAGMGQGGPLGPDGIHVLTVPGIPAQTAAVVLNVTAVNPTQSSFLTVYPDAGTTPPTAPPHSSSVDFTQGQTTSNLVIVPVGANGAVDIFNHIGSTNVLVDLLGFYVTSTGGTYTSATPTRLLDTRNGTGLNGAPPAKLGPGATLPLQVTGIAGVPATGVTSVVINLAATGSTASSFLTVYADGSAQPSTSNLNFSAGQTLANLVVVPVTDGLVDIFNHIGTVDLVADLVGYYTGGPGTTFTPLAPPTQMINTTTSTPLTANQVLPVQVTGGSTGVPATAIAIVTHVAVINDPTGGVLTLYADGSTQPNTSNLNFAANEIVSNLAVVAVATNGKIDIWNHVGTTDVVASITGYYS